MWRKCRKGEYKEGTRTRKRNGKRRDEKEHRSKSLRGEKKGGEILKEAGKCGMRKQEEEKKEERR